MMWFFAVLIVLALGGVAAVAAGHGRGLARVYDDRPDAVVPAGPLSSTDLRAVRFSSALVGYRASEVDALLRRLADQLEAAERGGVPRDLDDRGDRRDRGERPGD